MVAYQTIDVGAVQWTPIVALIDCNYFALWNTPGGWFGFGATDCAICSNPSDSATEKPLPAGAQELVAVANPLPECRWRCGEVMLYVKANGSTASLVLTCVR